MNKVKNILFPLIFIAISLAVVFSGFALMGYVNFDLKEPVFNDVDSVQSNDKLIEEITGKYISYNKNKSLSDDMKGLWIDASEYSSFSTEDEIMYHIYSDFDYYKNFLPDTVFLKVNNELIEQKKNDDFSIINYTVFCADRIGCDLILVADEDIISSDDEFFDDSIYYLLSEYDFNAVLFSCETFAGKDLYTSYFNALSLFLEAEYPEVLLGAEVFSDTESLFADSFTVNVFDSGKCDFGYVDCLYPMNAEPYNFSSVATWWNYFAEIYNIPFYCVHRLDKVFTSDAWNDGNEISEQMKVLYNLPQFDGSSFYGISSVQNKRVLARELSIFLNDVAGVLQDNMRVDSLKINNTDNSVWFDGSVINDLPVFCNDLPVAQTDNKFTVGYYLNKFENVFDFRCSGAERKYVVYNNISFFDNYYPDNTYAYEKNDLLPVYSVSPAGALVFALINGQYYLLSSENPCSSVAETPAGYCIYSQFISLEDIKAKDSRLTLLCIYDNAYSTVECGMMVNSVLFGDDNTDYYNVSNSISPYNDNNLGKSLMCIVTSDNTEQISDVSDYDTYHPYKSQLTAGTLDYVDGITVSDEGYLVYNLRSGINVYGTDAALINNAYTLPLNNIRLTSFNDSGDENTELYFSLDWLSPVTVTPENQDYSEGYLNFSFNIDNFDAEYFDLSFYYCGDLSFDVPIVLSENSVFSSYELYSSDNNTYFIRFYLKNPGDFYGFHIDKENDNTLKVSFSKIKEKSLEGKVIMLDPGHGGLSMVGTAVRDNSVSESEVTLNLALYTKKYLEQRGATVLLTRDRDTSLSLYERTVMCEELDPDIFVSIHCDGSEAQYESGTHTFYFTPFSHGLAKSLHENLVNAYKTKIYVEADDNYSRIDRKIKYYPFYVTRVDNCPSVLVETGFMTNYVEGNVLINPGNQDILAKAIADGIEQYFCN